MTGEGCASSSRITADSARPETVDYTSSRGFNIVPAIMGPRSIEHGVNFLKSYDIVVHPDRRHLADELIHYSWAVDRQTGEILPKLADANNHVEGARKARTGTFEFASAGRRIMADPYRGMQGGGYGADTEFRWGPPRTPFYNIYRR